MFGTFKGASSFNGDLSNWDVSTITTMYYLFEGATSFNGNITNWDVSNVQIMIAMFVNASSFNHDISSWNVSAATAMESMFNGATAFNQNLSAWDVSNVSNMNLMFNNATSFNHSLGSWDISSLPPGGFGMLDNSGLSDVNYDSTLIGWATLGVGETQIPSGFNLASSGLSYCLSTTDRAKLINTYGWTISGDTPGCLPFITTWKTDNAGTSASNQISIPTTGAGYNYNVNWGDGQTDFGVTGNATHTYAGTGTYTVSITGDFPRIYFNNAGDKDKILTVVQWGEIQWTSFEYAFYFCTNLTIPATDAPDLSGVTNMALSFGYCF
jgi:surface protein